MIEWAFFSNASDVALFLVLILVVLFWKVYKDRLWIIEIMIGISFFTTGEKYKLLDSVLCIGALIIAVYILIHYFYTRLKKGNSSE